MHLSLVIIDLLKVWIKMLSVKYTGLQLASLRVLSGSLILDNAVSLKEAWINHGDSLTLWIYNEWDVSVLDAEKQPGSISPSKIIKEDLVDLSRIKGLQIVGYYTIPDIAEIFRMTEARAKNVKNFTIGNKFGKVVWEGHINLLTILEWDEMAFSSISEIIEIKQFSVTVYPDDSKKPARGHGLNRPAMVYLFDIYPKQLREKLKASQMLTNKEVTVFENFKEKLRENVKATGGLFLNYSKDSGELCFSVSEF